MKKSFVTLTAIVLAAVALVSSAGCESSKDSKGSEQASVSRQEEKKSLDPALVGTWQAEVYHTRFTDIYSADGSLKTIEEDLDSPVGGGHYATSSTDYTAYTEGNKLYHIAVNEHSKGEFTYSVDGDTLHVITSTGNQIDYTRQLR